MTYLAYAICDVLFFSTHPFCLCMAMIVWFVTREQMLIQVMLKTSRRLS